jgi:hypothetical protein
MIRRSVWVVAAALAALACSATPTDSGPPPVVLLGKWTYTGTETGSTITISGTLTVASQSGKLLTGSAAWTEDDGMGGTTRLIGPVTGRALDSTSVTFDAILPSATRNHVGTVKADTIFGTWFDVTPGGLGASGAFRAVLQ